MAGRLLLAAYWPGREEKKLTNGYADADKFTFL
jgi:hypothetical protein